MKPRFRDAEKAPRRTPVPAAAPLPVSEPAGGGTIYLPPEQLNEHMVAEDPLLENFFPQDGRGSTSPDPGGAPRRNSVIDAGEPGAISQASINASTITPEDLAGDRETQELEDESE